MSDALDDPFINEVTEAIMKDPDPEWESWYALHGTGPSVVFAGGAGIPSMIDNLRFFEFKRGGIAAQREFDAIWRETTRKIRDGEIEIEELKIPDFESCGNCGITAIGNVFWDNATGWTCHNCQASDGDE